MKPLIQRMAAFMMSCVLLLSLAGCGEPDLSPVSVSEPASSASSSRPVSSEPLPEYPSSEEELDTTPSSKLEELVSSIQETNQSSKETSSQASSSEAASAPASSQERSSAPASSEELPPPSSSEPEVSSEISSESSEPEELPEPDAHEMKAVWLSFLEFQAFKGSSESGFQSKIDTIFDTIQAKGLNTVIVQVRPHGDSFYPSAYYPWSKCISGTMGVAVDYDPLEMMVEAAHRRGLQIHAWINPYRTMTDEEFATVDSSYPVKEWYEAPNREDYMVKVGTDSRWWLQPGNPEVQQLIINGATEIAQNYSVDGIHLDDYFYGTQVSAYGDSPAQAKENTSALVRGLYNGIKSVNGRVQFGISPAGGIAKNGLPSSDQGYLSTDLARWCSEPGYLDYVMPQIYWEYNHATQPFLSTMMKWSELVTAPGVQLYIGLAPYKLSAGEIEAQVEDIAANASVSGYCLFRYDHIGGLSLE